MTSRKCLFDMRRRVVRGARHDVKNAGEAGRKTRDVLAVIGSSDYYSTWYNPYAWPSVSK